MAEEDKQPDEKRQAEDLLRGNHSNGLSMNNSDPDAGPSTKQSNVTQELNDLLLEEDDFYRPLLNQYTEIVQSLNGQLEANISSKISMAFHDLNQKMDHTFGVMAVEMKEMRKSLNALTAQTLSKPSAAKAPKVKSSSQDPKPPSVEVQPLPVHSNSVPQSLINPNSLGNIEKLLMSLTQPPSISTPHTRSFPKKDRSESHPYRRSHLPPHPPSVQCSFCDSNQHYTRNCNVVLSVATRKKTIRGRNECPKCFKLLNHNHPLSCQPLICQRGCTDDLGEPSRHMDFLCPLNPSLDP